MRKQIAALTIVIALGLIGCSRSAETGRADILMNAHTISIGKTTVQEAESAFGRPKNIKKNKDGTSRYIWTVGQGRSGRALIIDFDRRGFAADYTTSTTRR